MEQAPVSVSQGFTKLFSALYDIFLGINRFVFSSYQKEANDINNCISETSFLLGV
jgi:hypothetical protein